MTGETTPACRQCGTEMNRHAEKLVEPWQGDPGPGLDPELGGFLMAVYSCPNCGTCDARFPGRPGGGESS